MFDFLNGDRWDFGRENSNLNSSAPISQLLDVVLKLKNELLTGNDQLTKESIDDSISVFLDATLKLSNTYYRRAEEIIRDHVDNNKLDSLSEVDQWGVWLYQEHHLWEVIKTGVNSDMEREDILLLVISQGYSLIARYSHLWLTAINKDMKLDWYDRFNHDFYIYICCYMAIKEKEIKAQIKSDIGRDNAKKRHEKSNITKVQVIALSKIKQANRKYKSRTELAKDLLPDAKKLAKANQWTPADDYQYINTIIKWLAAAKK